MICCSAGNNIDTVYSFQILLRKSCIIKIYIIIFIHSAVQCFNQHFRLLMNFLFHEKFISTFGSRFHIPFYMCNFPFYFVSFCIHNFNWIFFYFNYFIIFNQIYISCIFQYGRYIWGYIVFPFPKSYYKRTFLSDSYYSVRFIYSHNSKSIGTFYNFNKFFCCFKQISFIQFIQ